MKRLHFLATGGGDNCVHCFNPTQSDFDGIGDCCDPSHCYDTLENWTDAVDGVDGATIEVEDDGFGTDFRGDGINRVTVKLPLGESKLFWKLTADLP